MVYASTEDYLRYYTVVPENFDRIAERASRDIDTLTYHRIIGADWDSLTDFQRSTITECTCELIQFIDENSDVLDGVLNSYAINGVSMQFDFNVAVYRRNGVTIRSNTYSKLIGTGLCYAGGLR